MPGARLTSRDLDNTRLEPFPLEVDPSTLISGWRMAAQRFGLRH